VNHHKVLPEFYFDPSLFPDDFAFPQWAKSGHEFIYVARKILESSKISEILPQWIDSVFGPKSPACRMARTLFHKPHPARRPFRELPHLELKLNLGSPIIWAFLYPVNKPHMSFVYVTSDYTMTFAKAHFRDGQCEHEIQQSLQIPVQPADSLAFTHHSHVFAYCQARSRIFMAQGDKPMSEVAFHAQTSVFANYGGLIMFVKDQGCISRCSFKKSPPEATPVCYVTGQISVMAANASFQIVAFATRDGFVHIVDSNNGASLLDFDTESEVIEIVITTGWGFVIVLLQSHVLLFSVNGEFIKKWKPFFPIVKLFEHCSVDGFDFVSFVTPDDDIGLFEALYPEKQFFIARSQPGVIRVMYDSVHNLCIVFRSAGVVAGFPVPNFMSMDVGHPRASYS
jgi:hypothetical protein